MSHLIAGAYAAAPPNLADDSAAEDNWYGLLRAEPLIGGLELPWTGSEQGSLSLHVKGADRLESLLEPSWRSVVTAVPGTAQRMQSDPQYGLASNSPPSREQAVRDLEGLFQDVQRIRRNLGSGAIAAVELHSAPNRHAAASSAESLTRSLAEIASWDWDGVALALEHYDSGLPPEQSQKGFMPLDEEIAAVEHVRNSTPSRLGLTVNWGRSAIETRGADGPLNHIAAITSDSTLHGIMFSGAAALPTAYGAAFADVHVPLNGTGPGHAPESLMSEANMTDCMNAGTSNLLYTGVKVAALPGEKRLEDRTTPVVAALEALRAAEAGRFGQSSSRARFGSTRRGSPSIRG
jgi:hypothetical protein